jgi:hypothetical protein
VFSGSFGSWLESAAGNFQERRIKVEDYITVSADELSFHPGSKGQQVLAKAAQLGHAQHEQIRQNCG